MDPAPTQKANQYERAFRNEDLVAARVLEFEKLNRPGNSGSSGVSWVPWSRITRIHAAVVGFRRRASSSTGVSIPSYGAHKVWRQLNREGFMVGRDRIGRLMAELQLAGIRRGKVKRCGPSTERPLAVARRGTHEFAWVDSSGALRRLRTQAPDVVAVSESFAWKILTASDGRHRRRLDGFNVAICNSEKLSHLLEPGQGRGTRIQVLFRLRLARVSASERPQDTVQICANKGVRQWRPSGEGSQGDF